MAGAMDERLNRIEHTIEQSSGFGRIEIPVGAQWIEVAQAGPERLRLAGNLSPELEKSIATAARRWAEGQPGPALESLLPPSAPLLPTGYRARVIANLTIFGGAPSQVSVPLDVREAVFGPEANGDASFRTRDRKYSVHLALTPKAPIAPVFERRSTRYTGILRVRIQSDAGGTWERSYPADGDLETEGDTAVMPTGLVLPGASAPSPEERALHIKLDGPAEARVDVSLFDDPRGP